MFKHVFITNVQGSTIIVAPLLSPELVEITKT